MSPWGSPESLPRVSRVYSLAVLQNTHELGISHLFGFQDTVVDDKAIYPPKGANGLLNEAGR